MTEDRHAMRSDRRDRRHATRGIGRGMAGLALGACLGCAGDAGGLAARSTGSDAARPPSLTLQDSILLDESGDEYIGRLGALAVTSDGDLLVGDLYRARVVRYAPNGTRRGVYGRPGDGPGELRTPSAIALNGDTLLLVADSRSGRIMQYDVATYESPGSLQLPGFIRNIAARSDTLWIGAQSAGPRMAMARLALDEPDDVRLFMPYPRSFESSRHLSGAFTVVVFGLFGDTLMATFQGKPEWYLMTPEGTPRDSLLVPAVRRRGLPEDFPVRLARATSQQEQFAMMSYPWSAQRLSDGRTSVVYMDLTLDESLNLTMDGFVSVLSSDLKSACVDAPIRFSKDGQVRVAWDGDVLVTAEQVVGEGDRARTIVKRYGISTADCDWLPTGRAG